MIKGIGGIEFRLIMQQHYPKLIDRLNRKYGSVTEFDKYINSRTGSNTILKTWKDTWEYIRNNEHMHDLWWLL